jgi:hypothetical protein
MSQPIEPLPAAIQASIDQGAALLRELTDHVVRHRRYCDYPDVDACAGSTVGAWIDYHPYRAGGVLRLALVERAKAEAARRTREQFIDVVAGVLLANSGVAELPGGLSTVVAERLRYRAVLVVDELVRVGAIVVADDPLAHLDDCPGGAS